MSLATRARGRGPAGSASFPVPIRPMPECPHCRPTLPSDSSLGPRARGRPAVPGVLGPGPMSHRVYQVSRAIRVQVGGTAVLPSHPGSLGPGSEGPCVRQALPGKSRSGPMARGVDQISRASRAHARCPAGSTRRPRRLRPGSEGPRCHTALLGHSRFGPTDRGVDQLTRATLALCPKALGVARLSRASPACARGTVVWTTSPRRLKFGSEVPQPTCFPG